MFFHDFLIIFGLNRDILLILRNDYLILHNVKYIYNLVLCSVHFERPMVSTGTTECCQIDHIVEYEMGGHVSCMEEIRNVRLVGKPKGKGQLGILDVLSGFRVTDVVSIGFIALIH
jgi:hypothetical protein